MRYIGLDIHKKHTQACVRNEHGKILFNERFRTESEDIAAFFARQEVHGPLSVSMEATGFYFWIHDCIVARGHRVMVVHPARIKPLMKAKTKNDRNDASMLAELLRSGCLQGIYVPPPEIREMRDLTRHRESLVRKKGDLKREIVSSLDQHGVKTPSDYRVNFTKKYIEWLRSLNDFVISEKLDMLEMTVSKIKNVERLIEERWGEDEDVQIIRSVPGVGLVTATVLKAEIGDVARFPSAENLAAYIGVSPTTFQSGEKEWGGPARHGNNRVKHVLIEAALVHTRSCPDSKISRYHFRKRDSIGGKKAVVATGRKLAEALYFMLVRRQTFHAH
jgi:transposase